jgi:hypothetical protein
MVTVVVTLNISLALICLYVAWQVWKLGRVLAKVADTLSIAERHTHRVLIKAPNAIRKGQIGVYQLRQELQYLEQRVAIAQQSLGLLSVVMAVLRRRQPFRSYR